MQLSFGLRLRAWAPVLVAACMLAVGAQGVSAQSPTTLRVSTIPTYDNAAFEAAKAKGFFEEEGLKLDTTPTVGGAAGIPALVSGQIQVASSNIVTILLAASQGLNPVMVMAGDTSSDNPPDLAGLVTKKGNDSFKTGKDLEGKTVAVNARNNIIWLYCREWAAKTGGDPEKINFVEVPFPQMIDAVSNGRVDMAMLVEPFLSSGVGSGALQVVGWPFSEVQKRIPIAQFVMTKSYADEHPDQVKALVAAYNKGVEWATANNDSDEFFKIVEGYTKVPADRMRKAAKPIFVKTVDPESVEQVAALMKKHGLLKSDVDVKAIIHPLLLKQ